MRIVKLAHFNDQQLLIVDVLTILYKSVWVKGSEVHERFDCTLLNSSSWCNADDALILVVCRDGQLRLAGGSTPYEGRVEVCQNELWGTICDNPWNNDAATVVCTQLGHSRQSKLVMTPNTFFYWNVPWHLLAWWKTHSLHTLHNLNIMDLSIPYASKLTNNYAHSLLLYKSILTIYIFNVANTINVFQC